MRLWIRVLDVVGEKIKWRTLRPSGLVADDAKNISAVGLSAANILTLACPEFVMGPVAFKAEPYRAPIAGPHVAKKPWVVQLLASLAASDARLLYLIAAQSHSLLASLA